jgi:hypothetical protein
MLTFRFIESQSEANRFVGLVEWTSTYGGFSLDLNAGPELQRARSNPPRRRRQAIPTALVYCSEIDKHQATASEQPPNGSDAIRHVRSALAEMQVQDR